MTRDLSTGDSALARAVINEVGADFLRKTFNRSAGAISLWKRNGMPEIVQMYLLSKYPNLKAFGGTGEMGISRF